MLGPEEWKRLAHAMKECSELTKIEDFAWSEDVLLRNEKIDLNGRLIHDGNSGVLSPSFIVLAELLHRPKAASITDLDLRLNTIPHLEF